MGPRPEIYSRISRWVIVDNWLIEYDWHHLDCWTLNGYGRQIEDLGTIGAVVHSLAIAAEPYTITIYSTYAVQFIAKPTAYPAQVARCDVIWRKLRLL